MRIALIQSGVVVNVVEAPQDFAVVGGDFVYRELSAEQPCGPGWTFDGATFSPPADPPRTALSPRDFLSLFTSAELDAIDDSTNAIARAGKRLLYTLTAEVRLSAPELSQMLLGLQSIGLLSAGRVQRILSGQAPE